LAGAVGGIALGLGIAKGFGANFGWGLLALAGLIVVCVVLCFVARTQTAPESRSGEFMPGVLLGLNTGVNGVLIAAIVGPIAAVICVIRRSRSSSRSPGPTSTRPSSAGEFHPADVLGDRRHRAPDLDRQRNSRALESRHPLDLPVDREGQDPRDRREPRFWSADWAQRQPQPRSTGFNMGCFAFLRRGKASDYLFQHESGHTLNLDLGQSST
jgi:hypothetical protein